MGLLDNINAKRGQFITIKDVLLNISSYNNESLYDVAYYLSVIYSDIAELGIYRYDGLNFSMNEQASNDLRLLLYKVLDNITIGSGRDWTYSGKYSSFGDYWGDGEGLLKTLNSYPHSYLKKDDINNSEILSRLVSFDTKTPIEQLADANAKIADLENQLVQAKAELADKPADDLKVVPHQSYKALDKIMYAMAKITGLDNSKPYSQNIPSLNAKITTILQEDGLPLEYEAVGKWLSRINDTKPLK